jgi:hypothetical protein
MDPDADPDGPKTYGMRIRNTGSQILITDEEQ